MKKVVTKTQGPTEVYRLGPELRVFSEESGSVSWSLGQLTAHRLVSLLWLVLFVGTFYLLQVWLWPEARSARSIIEMVWASGHYLWLAGVPTTTMMFLGIMLYRKKPLAGVKVIPQTVVWRIVTRGQNIAALTYTIHRIQKEMELSPLFPYVIEVITESGALENQVVPILGEHIQFVHVPADYETPKRTRFKARALQYALEHSPIADDAWIVHLDEETCPTKSGILGIAKMIAEEEASGQLRIGQGAMVYHRQWKTHPFLTLADNSRTGMDYGPFYLQSLLGVSVFGFHGSYVVIRNDVEKATGGFDLGQKGDITEDAWWILLANDRGHRIRWVEGLLEEQSTQSAMDFLRQRRRWFEGLVKVVLHAPVPLWRRLPLMMALFFWGTTCFSILFTVAHLFYGFDTSPWIRAAANWSLATTGTMYMVGLGVNLRAAGITSPWKRCGWYLVQLLFIPAFFLMELIGGIWGFFFPQNGFHVVKK